MSKSVSQLFHDDSLRGLIYRYIKPLNQLLIIKLRNSVSPIGLWPWLVLLVSSTSQRTMNLHITALSFILDRKVLSISISIQSPYHSSFSIVFNELISIRIEFLYEKKTPYHVLTEWDWIVCSICFDQQFFFSFFTFERRNCLDLTPHRYCPVTRTTI